MIQLFSKSIIRVIIANFEQLLEKYLNLITSVRRFSELKQGKIFFHLQKDVYGDWRVELDDIFDVFLCFLSILINVMSSKNNKMKFYVPVIFRILMIVWLLKGFQCRGRYRCSNYIDIMILKSIIYVEGFLHATQYSKHFGIVREKMCSELGITRIKSWR